MEATDTSRSSPAGSTTEAESSQAEGATPGTRRKLTDQQEREVTRLYAETDTPVSEISKRFGIGESSVYRVAQRHGAALRGRTTPPGGTSTARPAASDSTPQATAQSTGSGRGRGRGRAAASREGAATGTGRGSGRAGRPPGSGRGRAAASSGDTAAAPAPRGRGGRPPGSGRSTTGGTATPSGNGRRTRGTGAAGGRAAGTNGRRAAVSAERGGGGRRSFRVSYVAVRVFTAADMADAIRQATAAGATDITHIQRND